MGEKMRPGMTWVRQDFQLVVVLAVHQDQEGVVVWFRRGRRVCDLMLQRFVEKHRLVAA